MFNYFMITVSSTGLLFGLVSLFTPIPGGILITALSMTGLICFSDKAQSKLRYLRGASKAVNWFFLKMEKVLGKRFNFITDALKRTTPSKLKG